MWKAVSVYKDESTTFSQSHRLRHKLDKNVSLMYSRLNPLLFKFFLTVKYNGMLWILRFIDSLFSRRYFQWKTGSLGYSSVSRFIVVIPKNVISVCDNDFVNCS